MQKELDSKLNRHFLACSAFVGTAVLMTGQNAEASIVYSGIQNAPVASTNGFGGVYLDIDGMAWVNPASGGGAGAAILPGWDIQPYRSSGTFGNALRMYTEISPSSAMVLANPANVVDKLDAGFFIDSSSTFDNSVVMIEGAGDWNDTIGYMGFQFTPDGTTLYGWMRIQTGAGGGDPTSINGGPGFPAVIIDWAYEDTGAGISVAAVPEPGTLALGFLGAGAAGLVAWRKRKKS